MHVEKNNKSLPFYSVVVVVRIVVFYGQTYNKIAAINALFAQIQQGI